LEHDCVIPQLETVHAELCPHKQYGTDLNRA